MDFFDNKKIEIKKPLLNISNLETKKNNINIFLDNESNKPIFTKKPIKLAKNVYKFE